MPGQFAIRLRIAQDRYKHWADAKRRHLEFTEGDLVFLRISPTRGLIRFGRRGKLSPRFIGPFPVDARVGEVAYRLMVLPDSLAAVHPVFHVSQLRRCIGGQTHFVDFSEIEVRPDLTYEQQPVEILDRRVKSLQSKQVQPCPSVMAERVALESPLGSSRAIYKNKISMNFYEMGSRDSSNYLDRGISLRNRNPRYRMISRNYFYF